LTITYNLVISTKHVGENLRSISDRLGAAVESALGVELSGGLIPSTRPAPTVVVPRGR